MNTYDIHIVQGETFELPIRWYTDSTKATLRDLSSHLARCQVRKTALSDEKVLDFAETGDIGLTNGSASANITLSLSASETAALPAPFKGVYELELQNSIGGVTKVLRGKFIVEPEVVR